MKAIVVAVLNIVLPKPNHSPLMYKKLWLETYKKKQFPKIHGDNHGMIGSAIVSEDENLEDEFLISGDLYKFTRIEMDGQWLNMLTGKAAEKEEVSNTVRIPKELMPNFKEFPYIFDAKNHRLIFISVVNSKTKLTPLLAKRIVDLCLNTSENINQFGRVEITIEPTKEALKSILSISRLKDFEIIITPPNALSDTERDILEFCNRTNTTKYERKQESSHADGLKLDDETKSLAQVAQSNGEVRGSGYDEHNEPVAYSTVDHPMLEKIPYNEKTTSQKFVLRSYLSSLLGKILLKDDAHESEQK